jgi:hypothetical protein
MAENTGGFPNFDGDHTSNHSNPDINTAQQNNPPPATPYTHDTHNQSSEQFQHTQAAPSPQQPPVYPPYNPGQQQYNQQQYYQQPYYPPQYYQAPPAYPHYNYQPPYKPAKPESGLAVASLVLSIVSVVFCWIPGLNILLSLLGLILGIVAKSKGDGGMAIAGIVIGAIMFFVSSFILVIIFLAMSVDPEGYHYYEYNNIPVWKTAFASLSAKFKLL